MSRRRARLPMVAFLGALLVPAACSQTTPGPETKYQGQTPDATVRMNEMQAAYIGSAGGGTGTLYYHGAAYPFTIDGIGIGGIGVSKVEATGDVYNLQSLSMFSGTYAQGRYGFAFGTASGGDLWLQNESGAVMHMKAKREGLMLSLGGDAMLVRMTH